MANIKIGRRDIIWSYVGNFLKLAINIILLPLILKYLSDDELGMWYVFASIGQLVILLDFGFAPALSRNISYVWCGANQLSKEGFSVADNSDTDKEYFNIVLTSCKYVYMVIAILALLILIFIGLPYVISLSNCNDYIIAWIIYSIGSFLNILYSYYSTFLIGVGAIAENNKSAVISKSIQVLTTFILLKIGLGLIGVAVAFMISGIALRMTSRYFFLNNKDVKSILITKKIYDKWDKVKTVIIKVWHNASKDGLVMISNYLSTQANTLICSSVLGLAVTGTYGLAVQISTMISSISSIPFASIQPALQESALRGNIGNSKKLFYTSMMAYSLSFLLLSLLLFSIGIPILQIFKPTLEFDAVVLIAILISSFIYQMYHLSASFISTFNTLPYTKSFIISSIISVSLSYILSVYTDIGVWALILPPIIVSMAYNAWKWPQAAVKKLNSNYGEWMQLGINGVINQIKSLI